MRLLLLFSLATTALTFAADLNKDLTFRATFDSPSLDADTALGDRRIYGAADYKSQASATPGLGSPDIEIAKGQGRKGDALRFKKKNNRALFYKADKNVAFDPKNWSGTISFWLNLDPDQDLEPGYCDPIQVTDKAYNDSAIWTDFTKDDKPRHFRLGVFGALKSWNPKDIAPDKNPDFLKRLVVVKQPAFARGKWTHVAITFSGLGSGKGSATLYVDAKPQGTASGIGEIFDWNIANGAIRLGVAYVGLMDDVSIFKRPLTAAEIQQIRTGKF
jgi:hypothetical protein